MRPFSALLVVAAVASSAPAMAKDWNAMDGGERIGWAAAFSKRVCPGVILESPVPMVIVRITILAYSQEGIVREIRARCAAAKAAAKAAR